MLAFETVGGTCRATRLPCYQYQEVFPIHHDIEYNIAINIHGTIMDLSKHVHVCGWVHRHEQKDGKPMAADCLLFFRH